jgi:hypothetical protein
LFDRKVREIERHREKASEERATVDERYNELHTMLMEVANREATVNNQEMSLLHKQDSTILELSRVKAPAVAKSEELTALHNEVERLSAMLLEIELPEPPDPPAIPDSWAVEEIQEAEVLMFDSDAQAA